jgi:hypothetical protein
LTLNIFDLNASFIQTPMNTEIINPDSKEQRLQQDPNGHNQVRHHRQNFSERYVFSQDHKMIAKQYLITGIIWAIIGGGMSVVFRFRLAYPDRRGSGDVWPIDHLHPAS